VKRNEGTGVSIVLTTEKEPRGLTICCYSHPEHRMIQYWKDGVPSDMNIESLIEDAQEISFRCLLRGLCSVDCEMFNVALSTRENICTIFKER